MEKKTVAQVLAAAMKRNRETAQARDEVLASIKLRFGDNALFAVAQACDFAQQHTMTMIHMTALDSMVPKGHPVTKATGTVIDGLDQLSSDVFAALCTLAFIDKDEEWMEKNRKEFADIAINTINRVTKETIKTGEMLIGGTL